MVDEQRSSADSENAYPRSLLEWAGHRSGGVRRLFDVDSGRPGQEVFDTNLLLRLKDWASQLAEGTADIPRVVLLVGGPGNGKTEAVEATVQRLDEALGCDGRLVNSLSAAYHPPQGQPVSRFVDNEAGAFATPPRQLRIGIVQDASVGSQAARKFVDELRVATSTSTGAAYLCCVNRGVLDDAMIYAVDQELSDAQALLEAVVRAVSLMPDAPSCWPLEDYPSVAVWPMDAESLLEPTDNGSPSPAKAIVERALDSARWPEADTCPAGPKKCPFCGSRKNLANQRETDALLRMLRWFELGTGKRWTFRDLFSLMSYLLAGNGRGRREEAVDPCAWAAAMAKADKDQAIGRPKKETSAAMFWLVAAQYQHALFYRWDQGLASSLYKDIKELGLKDNHVAMGLYFFLQSRTADCIPATIAPLLDSFVDLLDPAMSPPDTTVTLWGGETSLGEFDIRFSRSVRDGLDYALKYRALSPNERELLERLSVLDELLGEPKVRQKRPTSANRMRRVLRDFACRLTRRSIGARHASVPDACTFEAFQRVVADVDGTGHELHGIAIHIEDLLNNDRNFEVSLTTTFGQPWPPARRRATLIVPGRKVYPRESTRSGRPRPTICFLDVEAGLVPQPIALTYDLFKAVIDLEEGLSQASLPKGVLAMLDTTRARMAGAIVRDRNVQDRPTIVLGESFTVERSRGRFVAVKRGARR